MADSESTSRDEPSLTCVVVTPEKMVVDRRAAFVALPLSDGEIGIAPGHSPMIGRLGYGEMRVDTHRYYVDGGFVQVVGNEVSVLTNRAVPADEIDAEVAAEQLHAARDRRAAGDEPIATRARQIARARAQLRVARRKVT